MFAWTNESRVEMNTLSEPLEEGEFFIVDFGNDHVVFIPNACIPLNFLLDPRVV